MSERWCNEQHISIRDAIVHAEKSLGSFRKPALAYRGTMRHNEGVIVGFKLSPSKRWRLDYGPVSPAILSTVFSAEHLRRLNVEQPVLNWVHVNEEDFDAPARDQKIVHLVERNNDLEVSLYYQKWNKNPGYI